MRLFFILRNRQAMQQKASTPREKNRIPAREKFEDRPMSSDTWDDLILLLAYQTVHAVL